MRSLAGTLIGLLLCTALARADGVGAAAIRAIKMSVFSAGCLPGPNQIAFGLEGNSGTGFFVSNRGDFITAKHVIQEIQNYGPRCNPVIFLPEGRWEDQTSLLNEKYFRFNAGACVQDQLYDIAVCRTADNPFADATTKGNLLTVTLDPAVQPDGTDVAFTGFPLGYNQPVTAKASLGTNQKVDGLPEITIAGLSWHGTSGAPVYTANHKVIGMIVAGEKGEAAGLTLAVPASGIVEFLRANGIRDR